MIGITVAFLGLLATLIVTLAVTARLDGMWRILRRAAGYEQKDGILVRVWMWSAVLAGTAFVFWFFIVEGPGPSIAPTG
jgi:hypothetical protein